jgi:hypothetical protein
MCKCCSELKWLWSSHLNTTPWRCVCSGSESITPWFLNSALDGCEWSASCPGRITVRDRNCYLLNRALGGPHNCFDEHVYKWVWVGKAIASEFLATDQEVSGSIPGAIRFSEKQWVWNGLHQPCEDNWRATRMKKLQLRSKKKKKE